MFLLLISLVAPIFLIAIFYKYRSQFKNPNLPPGNYGLPYIGETFEFISATRKGHPEKFIFDRIAKYSSNVFKTSLLTHPAVVFHGATANKFLFSNENKVVVPWMPESMKKLLPYALSETISFQEWAKKMRKILPLFLKPEALKRYIGIMDSIAQRHFESEWTNKKEVLVAPLAKNYNFLLACGVFLSIDEPDRVSEFAEPFNMLVAAIMSFPIDFPGTPFNRGIKASNLIRKELLRDIIKQRKRDLADGKASATQDILSHMLVACDDEGMHMHELLVADQILAMVAAGHDTASSVCTFVVNYLADLPNIYEQVYKEQMEIAKSKAPGELLNWDDIQKMKYSWNVACEAMRLAPPASGGFREAIHDFVFDGFSIPKGWKVYWSASATHKNSEYFPEPEKFDPTRFDGSGPAPYTFIPFGGGPRMCPGKEYARLEILVFIHNLVKRYKFQRIIPYENITIDHVPRPAKGISIRLFPHN